MNLMYSALIKKYEAEKAEAKAILNVYFNNPAGIGEHPDLIEEMDKLLGKLGEAEDKIETLKNNFDENGQAK
jgi:hypothetical protein